MRRSPALLQLSREHHRGLVLAKRVRRFAATPAARPRPFSSPPDSLQEPEP